MTSLISVDPKQLMAHHPRVLREYARREIVSGERLAAEERDDRARRMEEFLAIGRSFRLTDKEIVSLIYGGLFR